MRVVRWRELRSLVQLSRSTVARLERSGDFPKRVHLSGHAVGWIDSQIKDWLRERIEQTSAAERDGAR
jgi:prophage regulatory protein